MVHCIDMNKECFNQYRNSREKKIKGENSMIYEKGYRQFWKDSVEFENVFNHWMVWQRDWPDRDKGQLNRCFPHMNLYTLFLGRKEKKFQVNVNYHSLGFLLENFCFSSILQLWNTLLNLRFKLYNCTKLHWKDDCSQKMHLRKDLLNQAPHHKSWRTIGSDPVCGSGACYNPQSTSTGYHCCCCNNHLSN